MGHQRPVQRVDHLGDLHPERFRAFIDGVVARHHPQLQATCGRHGILCGRIDIYPLPIDADLQCAVEVVCIRIAMHQTQLDLRYLTRITTGPGHRKAAGTAFGDLSLVGRDIDRRQRIIIHAVVVTVIHDSPHAFATNIARQCSAIGSFAFLRYDQREAFFTFKGIVIARLHRHRHAIDCVGRQFKAARTITIVRYLNRYTTDCYNRRNSGIHIRIICGAMFEFQRHRCGVIYRFAKTHVKRAAVAFTDGYVADVDFRHIIINYDRRHQIAMRHAFVIATSTTFNTDRLRNIALYQCIIAPHRIRNRTFRLSNRNCNGLTIG